jgi:hypothetical protein
VDLYTQLLWQLPLLYDKSGSHQPSPSPQTIPAASFRATQPSNDPSTFVLHHPTPKRSQQLRFMSPNPQTIPAASFRVTQPPSDHPTPKQSQQLRFVSPNPQTIPAASFRVTQPPSDSISFVSCHSAPKRSQQLCFMSPSPQMIPLASFRMTQPHVVYILKYNYSLRHVRPMSETGYRPVVNWSEP